MSETRRTGPKVSKNFKLLRSVSISELVYTEIHRMILSGDVLPGDHLNENKLAADLDVSRATIREACRKLEQDGLIQIAKNKGPFVRELSPDEALELYEIRAALEALAAGLSAKNRGSKDLRLIEQCLNSLRDAVAAGDQSEEFEVAKRFHELIWHSCGNANLADTLSSIAGRITLFRLKFIKNDYCGSDVKDEEEIFAAIAAQDEKLAGDLMRAHVLSGREQVTAIAREQNQTGNDQKAG